MLEFAMNKSSILDGSFDAKALQEFILISCQDSRGGLRDKPDKYVVVSKYFDQRKEFVLCSCYVGGPERYV